MSKIKANVMNLSIKKLNYNQSMSQGTPCFTCDLYEGDKLVAHVSNTGRGGSSKVEPAKGLTFEDVEIYTTLDLESHIFELVEVESILKKYQSKAIVLKKDEEISTIKFPLPITKFKKHHQYNSWIANVENKFVKQQGFEILNNNL